MAIARVWRGVAATSSNADAYERHVTKTVIPSLAGIAGHRGAQVLRRVVDKGIEFVVITRWESMEAVRRFAGDKADVAVVEPAARAVLSEYDDFVSHYEVSYESGR